MSDFRFSNLSPVPTDRANRARLRRVSDVVRTLFETKGLFAVLTAAPAQSAVTQGPGLRRCNGGANDLAGRLGAGVAITGEKQKVSNLILNLNAYVKPLARDAAETAFSVHLRGGTDGSFDRGIR